MSIDEQVNKLRYSADIFNTVGSAWELNRAEAKKLQTILRKAADTIESITKNLQAANKERSADDCCGWILCKDRFPEIVEYMGFEPTPYMKRLEIAYMTDTVEYVIGFYNGSKWLDKHHNIIKNVIAWKPFVKMPNNRYEP